MGDVVGLQPVELVESAVGVVLAVMAAVDLGLGHSRNSMYGLADC